MPYPIVEHPVAKKWWRDWKNSGEFEVPSHFPEHGISSEGDSFDWEVIVAELIDELETHFDFCFVSPSGGIVDRVAKVFTKSGDKVEVNKIKAQNLFEREAAILIHQKLPRDIALADPSFWIWMATGPGRKLICRRYPVNEKADEPKIADYKNFTSPSADESFFYRLWVRAELTFNDALEDPYELTRWGAIEFWRSHVFRQMTYEARPLLEAFIKFQHPFGPDGGGRLERLGLRDLVKVIKRKAANFLVETLDQEEAQKFIEDCWISIQDLWDEKGRNRL